MMHRADPRPYQIAVLAGLLVWGSVALDFGVTPGRAALLLASALAAQAVCGRRAGRTFDPRSALISGLGLAVLMRTDAWIACALVPWLAIGSKFVLQARGKHLWNPTCFALVVAGALSDRVWISSGQWGSAALGAFALAALGIAVAWRTRRSDVTWAFLGLWSALVLGRAAWLGDPWAVPLHGLQSGALLVFAFFMISDPRTIPDSRPGRLVFAAAVVAVAGWLRFVRFEPDAHLWALFACAPLVPLLDRWLPGERWAWRRTVASPDPRPRAPRREENPMRRPRRPLRGAAALLLAAALAVPWEAAAFCGFYVAKADTKLFNRASQVVLVRDGDRTVITMASDYRGDPEEFALVVPVPTFLEREQIHVGDPAVLEHLDRYTAPRLVEYFDPDPCAVFEGKALPRAAARQELADGDESRRARADGVVVEARYSVGEYDILILSAEESQGLSRWLRRNGYRIPAGAEPVLASYLKQDMHFFVARVDLEEHARRGSQMLRPLQMAFESPRFMLPIRLGTVNADGPQDLFVYALTRTGRVETTNYRSVKLPTGTELPAFVKDDFGRFYEALFSRQVEEHAGRAVFLEYAWDMAWCDPCAADPLSPQELRSLGVWWTEGADAPGRGPKAGARDVYVTRLHVRYDREHFPADLAFRETGDRSNFQGRYVVRHAFAGDLRCEADAYWKSVRERRENEVRTLTDLTGWPLAEVRRRAGLHLPWIHPDPRAWWERLWN